jgi:hypothetical protein
MTHRVLVYKRTHPGDPDVRGVFGCEDCIGTVRNRDFGAVIGVGGIGRESRSHDLDRKLHWIGVGPTKLPPEDWMRGPFIVFERYIDYGRNGPLLMDVAPLLAKRFYSSRLRHMMDGFTAQEQAEIENLLLLASVRTRTRRLTSKPICKIRKARKRC